VNNFADRLAAAVDKKKSVLCVGLDPRPELFPEEIAAGPEPARIVEFCRGVIEAVAPYAVAVKPQIAFFEEWWEGGAEAFRTVCSLARSAGLLVIADAKRGDIADTAEAYARAFLDRLELDALTVNPYLGMDALQPFVRRCSDRGLGLFVLAKTSNPSSADFQDLEVDGVPVYLRVARKVLEAGKNLRGRCGYSSLGIVVGATHREQAARLRAELPDLWFLVPGYGAQGATLSDVAVCFDGRGLGAIVNSSRAIIYAHRGGQGKWPHAVGDAARRTRDELAETLGRRC
jgi:orotidine-5'-phosphate decarboxylase